MKITSNTIKSAAAGLIAAAGMAWFVTAPASDDNKALACNTITDLAVATFQARTAGMTEAHAFERLRARKLFSGPEVWAVKTAFKVAPNTSEFVLRGSVYAECHKRDDVGAV